VPTAQDAFILDKPGAIGYIGDKDKKDKKRK
jgi:hypothetical protein